MSNRVSDNEYVLQEGRKALLLGRKNFKKGLKLANKLCSEYGDVPNAYMCKAEVILNHANELADTSKEKQKLIRDALEAAQFALVLAPNDLKVTFFHAMLLYEMANDEAAYSVVVKECHDALQLQPDQNMRGHINAVINDALNGGEEKRHRGENRNPVKSNPPVARGNVEREYTQQEVERQKRWAEKSEEKRAIPNHEFITKNGEYWRNSSSIEKCEILDVSVEDLESFFAAGDNKNLRAVTVCREAVEWYRKKGHWVTWTCCLCGKDEFDDWSALEEHMDDLHFHGVSPKNSENLEVNVLSNSDGLELDDNGGKFILDKQGLVGWLGNDELANEIFLLSWLRSDFDIEMALGSWDKKKMEAAQMGLKFSKEIEDLVQEKLDILTQVKELQQENMGSSEQLEEVHQESMKRLEGSDKVEKEIWSNLEIIEELHKEREETLKEIEDIRQEESMGNLGQAKEQQQGSIRKLEMADEEKQLESTKILNEVEEEQQKESLGRFEIVEEEKQQETIKSLNEFEEERQHDRMGKFEIVEEEKQPETTKSLNEIEEEQQQDSIGKFGIVEEEKQPESSKTLDELEEEQQQDSVGNFKKVEEEKQLESTKSLDKVEEEQQQERTKSLEKFDEQQKQEGVGSLKQQRGEIKKVEKSNEMEQETMYSQKIASQQKNKENLERPGEIQSENESKGKSIHDEEVMPKIKMYTQKVVSEKISSLDAKIIALKQTAMRHSAFEYRETLIPIIKSFIQYRLNSKVEETARKRAHAAMEDLVGEVDDEDIIESKKSKKNKKKKGKQ